MYFHTHTAANKQRTVELCELDTHGVICLLISSPAAGSQSASARGGRDDAGSGGSVGGGHQLAALPGGCAPTLGNHLPESSLPHQPGHSRETPLCPHIR